MRFLLLLSALVIFFISCGRQDGLDAQEELRILRTMVGKVNAKLNTLGFNLNPNRVSMMVANEDQMINIFNDISDRSKVKPRGGSITKTKVKKKKFRDGVASRYAFYDPNSKTLIFKRGAALDIDEGYIAHELAHVYQDQQWGLKNVWVDYKKSPSKENFNIAHYILEGHAELTRQAFEQESTTDPVSVAGLRITLGNMFTNECVLCLSEQDVSSLPYAMGMRFLLHRYKKGGWKKAEGLLYDLPSSTEQILHPDKYLKDKPGTITLKDFSKYQKGIKSEILGTMGEAHLLMKLLNWGIPKLEAFLSASGWDADMAHMYKLNNGDEAFVWRIAFDRKVDANQLEHSLKKIDGSFAINRNGRIIDLIKTDNKKFRRVLKQFLLRNQETYLGNKADEDSTRDQELKGQQGIVSNYYHLKVNQVHIGPKIHEKNHNS